VEIIFRGGDRKRATVDMPRLSIVTPSLNHVQYLGENIASLRMQTYRTWEHLVIDGGSTDGTLELLRGVEDERLRWVSEADNGQAAAITKGFAAAKGEIVTWLNADDIYLHEHVFEHVIRTFARQAEVDVVTAGGWYLDRAGNRLREIPPPEEVSLELLKMRDVILQPATFLRRSVVEDIPLDNSLDYAFDWDFFIRAAGRFRIVVLNTHLAGYRLLGTNKSIVGGSRRTAELAEVTGRYLGKHCWQYRLLKLRTRLDRSIERVPYRRLRTFLSEAVSRAIVRPIWELSGRRFMG
jgi:glycosyltransferase involved in cell wall biosynthesis